MSDEDVRIRKRMEEAQREGFRQAMENLLGSFVREEDLRGVKAVFATGVITSEAKNKVLQESNGVKSPEVLAMFLADSDITPQTKAKLLEISACRGYEDAVDILRDMAASDIPHRDLWGAVEQALVVRAMGMLERLLSFPTIEAQIVGEALLRETHRECKEAIAVFLAYKNLPDDAIDKALDAVEMKLNRNADQQDLREIQEMLRNARPQKSVPRKIKEKVDDPSPK